MKMIVKFNYNKERYTKSSFSRTNTNTLKIYVVSFLCIIVTHTK